MLPPTHHLHFSTTGGCKGRKQGNTKASNVDSACIFVYAWHADGAEEGDLRLQDEIQRGNNVSGVLEIFHAGAWGTVCDSGFLLVEVLSDSDPYGGPDYNIGITIVRCSMNL